MDGAPVFNMVRNNLPGVRVLGFTGVLNSTSKVIVETMERGGTFAEGLEAARKLGITEADGAYDVEGWDSAAKTAALANVFMDAGTTPQAVSTRGIGRLTPERVQELARAGKTVRLVSRARRNPGGISLRVRAEVLDKSDILAAVTGTSNLLLLHTDHMGTLGTVSIAPGVRQTAYGVFIDLVDLLRIRLVEITRSASMFQNPEILSQRRPHVAKNLPRPSLQHAHHPQRTLVARRQVDLLRL